MLIFLELWLQINMAHPPCCPKLRQLQYMLSINLLGYINVKILPSLNNTALA